MNECLYSMKFKSNSNFLLVRGQKKSFIFKIWGKIYFVNSKQKWLLNNPLQVVIPLLPTVAHHLGPSLKHFIDKLHISNHTDPWCLANFDPYKERELDGISTVACEQFNFWGDGFKHMVKHMNYPRFHFFLFVMFDFINKSLKSKNQLYILNL